MKLEDILVAMEGFETSVLTGPSRSGAERHLNYMALAGSVRALQQALSTWGLQGGEQIVVHGDNSVEWVVWDLALTMLGCHVVAVPTSVSGDALQAMLARLSTRLWIMDNPLAGAAVDTTVVDMRLALAPDELASLPALKGQAAADSLPGDLLTRVFSSGTSGHLKGLDISRQGTLDLVTRFASAFSLNRYDRHVMFLPLFNYQQRMTLLACFMTGCSVDFVAPARLFQALGRLSPTFLIAPPVFYETALRLFSAQGLSKGLGGKVRFLITGMAPSRMAVLEAFERAGLVLCEVYGATETGMICWNQPSDRQAGTVGRPVNADDVLLSAEGEVLVSRAHPLSLGYFADPQGDGARVFDRQRGLIATGDLGRWTSDGRLVLEGRLKELIMTSGGLKFHPSEIERHMLEIPGVLQACVVADPDNGSLDALVGCAADTGPDLKVINDWRRQWNDTAPAHLRVRSITRWSEEFTVANGLLTLNMKLNRPGVARCLTAREAGHEN